MKIIIFANTSWNIFNYRVDLIDVLISLGHDVHLLSPKDEFTEFLTDSGYTWHPFKLSRKGMNPFQEVQSMVRLRRVFHQIQPDIIFNFTPKCVLYGSIVGKMHKIPTIVNTITGLGYLFSGYRMKLFLIREGIRWFYRLSLIKTLVIFQNHENKEEFINRRIINQDQAFLVRGSGVDIERFTPVDEAEGIPVVLLPARLIEEKGVFEFIEAVRLLKVKKIAARFVLVGKIDNGNPSAISYNKIQDWVDEGVVEWWGWRPDIEKVFAESHLVCLPTYYNEGIPKTLIEAAACGRAIIASDVPGCREIVYDGDNGVLVAPRNGKLLADAIEKLLRDSVLRRDMGKSGRKHVEDKFQNSIIIAEMLKIAGIENR